MWVWWRKKFVVSSKCARALFFLIYFSFHAFPFYWYVLPFYHCYYFVLFWFSFLFFPLVLLSSWSKEKIKWKKNSQFIGMWFSFGQLLFRIKCAPVNYVCLLFFCMLDLSIQCKRYIRLPHYCLANTCARTLGTFAWKLWRNLTITMVTVTCWK